MTNISRDKKTLEKKIVEIYLRLHKRKTTKISRKINLQKRLEFYKAQLEQLSVSESSAGVTGDVQDAPTSITVE